MQAPEGYVLQKLVIASPRVRVYLALRERDRAEVVLKAYPERGHFAAPERAQRELDILRSLPPGVSAQALALERTQDHRVLVLERLAGETPRGPLTAESFLALSIGAAQAVSRIHATRIVHRNLRPENLLVRADFAQVRIVGCGQAAPLGAPALGDAARAFDGPLLYMSPEQTGRLERGVDFRSDMYALGATFYELLSGRPPFDARDPLDLIHAHIAHRARPLVEIAPEIPGTLSRIVMKLLEKDPEDRYQTAEALQVDLESCREQLQRTGAIDDELALGAADAPYRPLFRQRVYGRDAECAALRRSYERASQGTLALVLVRGAPGVGKSALVPELHRPLALDGGYLVRGKFDLYRGHVPYAGFASALGSLLRQIASESDARRDGWRRALSEALGPLAAVVADLTPELRQLLGELAPVPKLEPLETQQRLGLAVRRFLLAAARYARPLVLFLDDLQWADAGSRYLLEELLARPEGDMPAPLLAIGSYRDSEVRAEHPLLQLFERVQQQGTPIESLALGPLSDAAACDLLADALGHPRERVRELAARVARHSGNNPLLIQQCIYHLHELGCLRFVPGQGWTWDFAAIDAAVIPEDPVGMMLSKLQRLRGDARSVAQFASCVGDEFDVGLLAELSRRERAELETALYELSDEGLIAPCQAGFHFVHDRIREAAQALLPEQQRAQLHLRTATLLLERTSEAEQRARCFEIADHLCRAASAIPEDMRVRAIELHRTAGICALEAGACATAAHYTEAGLALFTPQDWTQRPDLGFELHMRASESAYQMRDFARAIALLEPLEERSSGEFQRSLVAAQRIKVYALSRSVEETLELTLATLRGLRQPLPRRPSWLRTRWEIARVDWQLRGPEAEWKFHPPTSMGAWMGELMVRSTGGQAIGMTGSRLMCLNCAAIVRTTLRHGHIATPGFALAAYAAYRGAALRRATGMQRYADAALAWSQRVPDPRSGARAELLVHAFVRPWTGPRHAVLDPLRRIAAALQEIGNVEYATNALLMRAHYLGLAGAKLPEVVDAFASVPRRGHLTPIEEPDRIVAPYLWLSRPDADPSEFERVRPELERFAQSAQFAATHWMLALCVLGRFGDAWWAAELIRPIIFERVATAAHLADYMLFRGMAAAALRRTTPGLRLRLVALRCERYLRRWARCGPDFAHMAVLLRAERAHAAGRSARALDLYARAAAGAAAQHHVHHAALAHERRGELLRSLGRESDARSALESAAALYREWGAHAKLG